MHGVSELSYAGTEFEPLFGTGQGSGASPAVWLTLVVILLNTLERVVPQRMSFKSPDNKNIHSRLVDAFVDDTALGFTDDGQLSLDEMVLALESMAQTWEQLLHFSGGTLNLTKCSWFVMFWDWKQGRPVIRAHQTEDPGVLLRKGSTETATPIKRQSVTATSRILGVYQNPMGDFSDHLRVMKQKADILAGLIKSPRLTKTDIRISTKPCMSQPCAILCRQLQPTRKSSNKSRAESSSQLCNVSGSTVNYQQQSDSVRQKWEVWDL